MPWVKKVTMEIRGPSPSDIDSIVYLHYSSKVKGILGHLPKKTLKDYFYKSILEADENLSLVAIAEDGKIVGYCCISSDTTGYPDVPFLTKINVGICLVKIFFIHPRIAGMVVNQIRGDIAVKRSKLQKTALELKILIVDSNVSGRGIGTSLMLEALSIVSAGNDIIVRTQNPLALDFYRRFGFRFAKEKSFFSQKLWLGLRKGENKGEQF
jgi:ribosomal protein S18 acetylase RimI-like enzyme